MASPAFDINSPLPELVEATLKQGPLVLTKEGVETAVLVSIEEWKSLNHRASQFAHDPQVDAAAPDDLPVFPRIPFELRPFDFDDPEEK